MSKALLFAVLLALTALPAQAHRSGCHRWHSCPSDTGSYTMGSPAPSRVSTAPRLTPTIAMTDTRYTTTNVNLRAGAASTTAKITTLPTNTAVAVMSCTAGWCRVVAAQGRGYVSQKFLR